MTAPKTITAVAPADWVTIWQSELAALAVDRECADALLLWGQAWVDAGEPAPRCSSPDAAAGATPAGAAPDVERGLQWLRDRVAELGG